MTNPPDTNWPDGLEQGAAIAADTSSWACCKCGSTARKLEKQLIEGGDHARVHYPHVNDSDLPIIKKESICSNCGDSYPLPPDILADEPGDQHVP